MGGINPQRGMTNGHGYGSISKYLSNLFTIQYFVGRDLALKNITTLNNITRSTYLSIYNIISI